MRITVIARRLRISQEKSSVGCSLTLSRYTFPGRTYFADVALPELYQAVYLHVHSLLKTNTSSFISFTSDIWSSDVSPLSMLSLPAQWIDADFQLQKVVLHLQDSGTHTAAALATVFENMLFNSAFVFLNSYFFRLHQMLIKNTNLKKKIGIGKYFS